MAKAKIRFDKMMYMRMSIASYNKIEEMADKRGMNVSSLARFWLEERIKKEDNKKRGD